MSGARIWLALWVAVTFALSLRLGGLSLVLTTTIGLIILCIWARVKGHNK